jgi:hypothetical protein
MLIKTTAKSFIVDGVVMPFSRLTCVVWYP